MYRVSHRVFTLQSLLFPWLSRSKSVCSLKERRSVTPPLPLFHATSTSACRQTVTLRLELIEHCFCISSAVRLRGAGWIIIRVDLGIPSQQQQRKGSSSSSPLLCFFLLLLAVANTLSSSPRLNPDRQSSRSSTFLLLARLASAISTLQTGLDL